MSNMEMPPAYGDPPISYDFKAADEEVRYNISEVQWFNDQVILSESDAYLINQRWDTDGPELLASSKTPVGFLNLATAVTEVVREPLLIMDGTFRVLKANRGFYRTFGGTARETEHNNLFELSRGAWNVPPLKALLETARHDYLAHEELEVNVCFSIADQKTLRINIRQIHGTMLLMSVRDVTPRRRAEGELQRVLGELRQAQKLEIVGRLAGGIAHDFNNILTAILGFSELLMTLLDKESSTFKHAAEIEKAGVRGAALTQQLLAFSRRQVLRPEILNLNDIVTDLDQMLRRLLGDNIVLVPSLDANIRSMSADSGQIGQVILNLAINARDAMPNGGRLYVTTQNTTLKDDSGPLRELPSGDYVTLLVTDTGTGMDYDTQQRIFEPFFTTKPQGSGTGIGLATVFGIVSQSDGRIHFFSEVGVGTTFWIDFPRVDGVVAKKAATNSDALPTGDETILVVEDDDLVRDLVVAVLSLQGYTVLSAVGAEQALEICHSYPSTIDLLMTDLLMPGAMNGRELCDHVVHIRHGLKLLLMSGYTSDAVMLNGVGERESFLQKPFSVQQLGSTIRRILDECAVNAIAC